MRPKLEYDDEVTNGYDIGRVTGRVSDTEIRVYWYSGSNMYNETVRDTDVELIGKPYKGEEK